MQTVVDRVTVCCPICGFDKSTIKIKPWNKVTDVALLYGADNGIQGTQTIVKCDRCDMIYENPRFEDRIILESYKNAQNKVHDSQSEIRAKSFFKALTKLEKFIPNPGAKVLDVGTAGGSFLVAAKKFGYKVDGLEPSLSLVEAANKKDLNVFHGTIENNNLNNQSYDMICLWDVLEHVCDPKEALLSLSKLLKPNGILLINFPDVGTFQAKIFGKYFWWYLSVHLHYFTKKTITELSTLCGLRVVHCQDHWQTLEFGYLVNMANHLGVPFSKQLKKIIPKKIEKLPIPYYASQTTLIVERLE